MAWVWVGVSFADTMVLVGAGVGWAEGICSNTIAEIDIGVWVLLGDVDADMGLSANWCKAVAVSGAGDKAVAVSGAGVWAVAVSGAGGEAVAVSGAGGKAVAVSGAGGIAVAVTGAGGKAVAVSGAGGLAVAVSRAPGNAVAVPEVGGKAVAAVTTNVGVAIMDGTVVSDGVALEAGVWIEVAEGGINCSVVVGSWVEALGGDNSTKNNQNNTKFKISRLLFQFPLLFYNGLSSNISYQM